MPIGNYLYIVVKIELKEYKSYVKQLVFKKIHIQLLNNTARFKTDELYYTTARKSVYYNNCEIRKVPVPNNLTYLSSNETLKHYGFIFEPTTEI